MTLFALALILAAAFIHASWNLVAKRVGGGPTFVWLFAVLSAAIYTPLAIGIFLVQQPYIGPTQVVFIVGSGIIHVAYFLALQQGYKVGDLSLVYPIARGTGPMLATAAAVLAFGEHPSTIALAGAALIGIGVFVLSTTSSRSSGAKLNLGIAFGLLTGITIAGYTLWDKHAVSVLLIPPLIQDWGSNLTRAVVLTPVALKRWDEVRKEWLTHKREALIIGALTPLSYILVLTAMVFTPVSYVAPAREISILVGTAMGARLLSEGHTGRRLSAAAAMVLGVVFLAVG